MELTCPHCRHTVDIGEAESGKCGNCGQLARRPKPRTVVPHPEPERVASVSVVASATPVAGHPLPASSSNDAAAIASFVCGLLFFIPFVTQLIAIVCGVVALSSSKRRERGAAFAVIGLILAGFGVVGWMLVIERTTTAMNARMAGWTIPVMPADAEYAAAERAKRLADEMEQIQRAIVAFKRDFRRYPDRLSQIRGSYLAEGFVPSGELTLYFPVHRDLVTQEWPLVVSTGVSFDRDGAELKPPRRMLLRLGGRFEFLKDQDAEAVIRKFMSTEEPGPISEPVSEPNANDATTDDGIHPE